MQRSTTLVTATVSYLIRDGTNRCQREFNSVQARDTVSTVDFRIPATECVRFFFFFFFFFFLISPLIWFVNVHLRSASTSFDVVPYLYLLGETASTCSLDRARRNVPKPTVGSAY